MSTYVVSVGRHFEGTWSESEDNFVCCSRLCQNFVLERLGLTPLPGWDREAGEEFSSDGSAISWGRYPGAANDCDYPVWCAACEQALNEEAEAVDDGTYAVP